jgi:hypothetical protein
MKYSVVFSGASITNSPWYTWKDFTIERYHIQNPVENSHRGVGNEFIINSTIQKCQEHANPFVVAMLTNIDKWDWYVQDSTECMRINAHEKHPVRNLQGSISIGGFWSTGSWFPGVKEHYKKHYYSQDYFAFKTLQNIYCLQQFCKSKNIPCVILFDSPVLNCLEQDINNQDLTYKSLTDNELCRSYTGQIDWSGIYQPGLIGYCMSNSLEWFHSEIKGHPPSLSHLAFAEQHLFPVLDSYFSVKNPDLRPIAQKFQNMFYDI